MSVQPRLHTDEAREKRSRRVLAILAVMAAIVLAIGLSLTWFVGSKSLSTVGKVQRPADLKIMGPNQTTIEPIEISYDENRDVKNTDGTVTIRRAFCVKSNTADQDGKNLGGQAFELQLANTTNIKGLKINVYRVTDTTEQRTGDVVVLNGSNPYAWTKKGDPIGFTLINPKTDGDDSLAKELEENDPTFQQYQNVQESARPLYRYCSFAKSELDGYNETTRKAADATNFIIECTWNPGDVTVSDSTGAKSTVSNAKETDMVYLITRAASANTAN